MKKIDIPFNIALMQVTPEKIKNLKPVTSLDIFTSGSNTDFHEEGLFSTSIFGRVGDERRSFRFSYINIKVPILHPIVFKILVKTKRLYGDIISGTGFAKWDDTIKDFVKSNPAEGDTGYHFFLSHWLDIEYVETNSTIRDQNIALIKKYKNQCLTDKVIVMPAGLRDLEIDDYNRISEDEINTEYRRILALANTITPNAVKTSIEALDTPRYQMQMVFNNIYDKLLSMIEGKKKLFLGRFAARRIFNGTRNVITSMNTTVQYLGAAGNVDFNSTIIGLYQYLKATEPVSVYQIRQFITPIFSDVNRAVKLINKDTLKSEEVMLHSKYYDQWATDEGIRKVITAYKEESIRNKPLEINGRYAALIYVGPDNTFRVFYGIEDFPEHLDKQYVRPITLTEMLYLAVYKDSRRYPMLVTRYPITGIGSIYPSKTHLKPTLKSERRIPLDEFWVPMPEEEMAYEFPISTSPFINSLIPHPTRLSRLGAD